MSTTGTLRRVSRPPVATAGTARRQRIFSRALQVAAVLVLALLVLVTLGVVGLTVGPVALAIGLVAAVVPAPLYLMLALRIDRYEPEPPRLLAWAFFWGASGATFIALLLNSAGQALIGHNFGSNVGEIYGSSISAPVVEESAKAAVLFAIYRWRRREFDGVLDGITYAAMVGLGFATIENVLYYARAVSHGGVPLAATFIMRGVMSPFTHPVFTAMTGIGLGVSLTTNRRWLKALAPAAGLLTAMLLHSGWNTAATVGGGVAFFGVFFLVMTPVFGALLAVITVQLRREGKIIAEQLEPEVAAGILSAGDVLVLSQLPERRRMRRAAKRSGKAALEAWKEFADAAATLGFLRHRAQRGLDPDVDALEQEEARLGERLRALRPQLGAEALATSDDAAARAAYVERLRAAQVAGLPPPGWHHDPWQQAHWRWWDGQQWTGYVSN
jgi:RsiW-degrading membrane proteinase PrsW (M82 family)